MGQFFGSVYCWLFEDFFGQELANYLWGQTSDYQQSNMFIGIGLWMAGISLLIALAYYYFIDHPKLSKWWGWLIFAIFNSAINYLIGWQRTLYDYYEGIMVTIDAKTQQEVPLDIYPIDCICFGVTDAIIALFTFFVFSMIFKWKSCNSSHSPF